MNEKGNRHDIILLEGRFIMLMATIGLFSILVLYGWICYRVGFKNGAKWVSDIIEEVQRDKRND
jgi:hypothetical protein